ncbi:unnamed protein product [Heterosigma akashiwo]
MAVWWSRALMMPCWPDVGSTMLWPRAVGMESLLQTIKPLAASFQIFWGPLVLKKQAASLWTIRNKINDNSFLEDRWDEGVHVIPSAWMLLYMSRKFKARYLIEQICQTASQNIMCVCVLQHDTTSPVCLLTDYIFIGVFPLLMFAGRLIMPVCVH